MATWPTTLPNPVREGYGFRPGKTVNRTPMEVGSPRTRRVATRANDNFTVQWEFSQLEMSVFEAWYVHEAKTGDEWFTVEMWTGAGLVSVEAKFAEPYQAKEAPGLRFGVSATLEVRNRPIMTTSQLAPYL